ncbi:hypothetical protein ECFRIK1999_5817, partial [Escherichia coli FRIK1999]
WKAAVGKKIPASSGDFSFI